MKTEIKVGVFIAASIAILIWATLNIRSLPIFRDNGYEVFAVFSTAQGIRPKTPIEIAGVQVGYVDRVDLLESRVAKVIMTIDEDVTLQKGTMASVKSKGFLGETYIEIEPGTVPETLPPGSQLGTGRIAANVDSLTLQLSDIADDVKVITAALRVNVEGENSRLTRILAHMEVLAENLATFTQNNAQNFDHIVENLAALSADLKDAVADNRPNIDDTLSRIAEVTRKIDAGEGTLGRLVNDESTVERLNESLDHLNETLGTVTRLRTEIGYHTEYLGSSEEFKHYVDLKLKPRPDKYFLLELVSDPSPPPVRVTEERSVESGGITSTVVTESETASQDNFVFSAQLAKELYDFTIRGGIIESRGGVGLDYDRGPFGLSFSAFDFQNDEDERPHLKAWAHVDLTENFYLMSGIDDFASSQQDADWFLGLGVQFVDEDVKSLLGVFQLAN